MAHSVAQDRNRSSEPGLALGIDGGIPAPNTIRRLVFGSDHIGLPLKTVLVTGCRTAGYEVIDVGVHDTVRVDYTDTARAVVRAMIDGVGDMGVLVCGTGVGMQIAANRCAKIRAVVVNDLYTAHFARAHNDANLACFGARLLAPELATVILGRFLATPFEGGRHQRRVDKLADPAPIAAA